MTTTRVVIWGYSEGPESALFRAAPDASGSAWRVALRCGFEERHEPFWIKVIALPLAVKGALQQVWQEAQSDPTIAGWEALITNTEAPNGFPASERSDTE